MLNNRLPLSSRPDFVALPSDPSIPLTPEQDAALWGGNFSILARMIVDGYRASLNQPQHEQPFTSPVHNDNSIPLSSSVRERTGNGV